MNDQPSSPFVPVQPFQPQPATPGPTPKSTERPKRRASGKTRKAKKARKVSKSPLLAAPYGEAAAVAPAPKVRKPRSPKVDKAPVKRTLDIGTIISATAGLKPDDARVLVKIYGMLSEHSARSRSAIAASLSKLCG